MLRLSGPKVKYGKYCGYICVDENHPYYQGENVNADSLPSDGPVYVEMDYMCDIPFNIGLIGIIAPGDTILPANYFEQINPISTWNKIYIDLNTNNLLGTANSEGAIQYQIAYYVSLPSGASVGHVYLDNIKLVHF
jgi:hypothetical protein